MEGNKVAACSVRAQPIPQKHFPRLICLFTVPQTFPGRELCCSDTGSSSKTLLLPRWGQLLSQNLLHAQGLPLCLAMVQQPTPGSGKHLLPHQSASLALGAAVYAAQFLFYSLGCVVQFAHSEPKKDYLLLLYGCLCASALIWDRREMLRYCTAEA